MGKRSNILVVLGIAFFVLGAAIVALVVRDDDGGTAVGSQETQVLVARQNIPAGTTGEEIISGGMAESRRVKVDELAPGALTTAGALSGQTMSSEVAEGQQLTTAFLRPPPIRTSAIAIPDGMQAVALQLDFVPGVAGYVGQGDRVNLYSVVQNGPEGPMTKLVVSDVEVLDVSAEIAPRAAANRDEERPTGNRLTYLLALDAVQAERIIFLDANESLYFTLLPEGQGPSETPGQTYGSAL
jgi:pilus assembly protein CpaB